MNTHAVWLRHSVTTAASEHSPRSHPTLISIPSGSCPSRHKGSVMVPHRRNSRGSTAPLRPCGLGIDRYIGRPILSADILFFYVYRIGRYAADFRRFLFFYFFLLVLPHLFLIFVKYCSSTCSYLFYFTCFYYLLYIVFYIEVQ